MNKLQVNILLSRIKKPDNFMCYKKGVGTYYKRVQVLEEQMANTESFSFMQKKLKKENHKHL